MMQPSRRPHHEPQQPSLDPAWELVRRVPGVCKSAEDKLAWLYCWTKSRRGRQRISISAGEIAADQGVTSDAGRQRIKNLVASGLVILVGSDRYTGVYTVELAEPDRVMQARAIHWDGQLDLPFAAELETDSRASSKVGADHAGDASARGFRRLSAEEPPEEPRSDLLFLDSSCIYKSYSSSSPPSVETPCAEKVEGARRGRGTSGGTSDDADFVRALAARQAEHARDERPPPRDAKPLTEAAATYLVRLAQATPAETLAKARRLVEEIEAIAGEGLTGVRHVRLAHAIVEGRIREQELHTVLNYIRRKQRAGELHSPPSAYFNKCAGRLLRQIGEQVNGC